jgi:DNA-binding MarR family transcriptional regulator
MKNQHLTNLSKKVLSLLLIKSGPIKTYDLVKDLGLNQKSVRYALRILEDNNLVEKYPDLDDLRSYIYVLRPDNINNAKKMLN